MALNPLLEFIESIAWPIGGVLFFFLCRWAYRSGYNGPDGGAAMRRNPFLSDGKIYEQPPRRVVYPVIRTGEIPFCSSAIHSTRLTQLITLKRDIEAGIGEREDLT